MDDRKMTQPAHPLKPLVSAPKRTQSEPEQAPFWTRSVNDLRATLGCGDDGLSTTDASDRLGRYGLNADVVGKRAGALQAILRRLLEPLSLILLAAALVSAGTGDLVGGSIIATILILSIGLDTVQEGHAVRAADVLRQSVALTAEARRDGTYVQVPVENVVPGDMIRVRAGDIVPADGLVIESDAFAADEAALTGEPYPVEKRPGPVTGLSASQASGAMFRGAVAQTGEAVVLVVNTGSATIFGAAASALNRPAETSPFQADLRAYGLLVMRLTMGLVLVVLATSVFFGRPVLQSVLFAVALAVGLTPELLPMITTVTLSRGAIRMARRKVIVKRLASIHDLGAMTVLCTDKTGTLTSAHITLAQSIACSGAIDPRPSRLAAIAAILGGDRGALDAALVEGDPKATSGWTLLGRRAFDFNRRLGSIVAAGPEGDVLIAKGTPDAIIALCTASRGGDAKSAMGDCERAAVLARVKDLAEKDGLRAIAVASRAWTEGRRDPGTADETGLVFEGLCAFADPPKPTAAAAVARLAAQGIRLKILSGDDPIVVRRLSRLVGLDAHRVLSGVDIEHLSDDALAIQVRSVHAYGRLAPDQKSRLIRALQADGAVVGYLGDGINDAPALKAANIGLSVSGASGVAQAAADMILLDQDLAVVGDGVEEGRRTFANILKYIRMGVSSNFGNMLSMAAASVFLPFLPMLPTQILLNNLLYDISEIGIPFDSVRPEAIAKPQRWDMHALIRFAAVMGPLSSAFDLLTFGGLIFLFHVSPPEFRTAWFLESMATQILVIFIIRTNGRPWADRPRPILVATSLGALLVAVTLPFTPAAALFGFQTPPLAMTCGIVLLVLVYLMCAESLKRAATAKVLKGSRSRRPKVERRSGFQKQR